MLEVRSIGMDFGKKSLFQNVDLILLPTKRYGIVGANGTGKSTFLKIWRVKNPRPVAVLKRPRV